MFKNIKNWIKEHHSLIIGLLILVLMLKGCASCNTERQYEYQETKYEHIIDSMQTVIDERSIDTKDLCDTIYSLRAENTILKDVIKDLRDDKIYYQSANKDLNKGLKAAAEALNKKELKDTIK